MKHLTFMVTVFLSMCAWGVLHSWLAAFSTKALLQRIFGKKICRFYRLVFIAVAGITLLPILGLVVFLPARVLWRIPAPWLYFTLALQFLALFGLVFTVLQVDTLAFVGLRQLRNPDAETDSKLVTRGFYRWVRHPLYFFSLVILWLLPITTDLSLAFVIASSLYFIVGPVPEERKLVILYGEPYREYQETVPRIIPCLRIF